MMTGSRERKISCSTIPFWDLHCDTIFEIATRNESLGRSHLHLDLSRGEAYVPWVQTFALWIEDTCRGEDSFPKLERLHQCFLEQLAEHRHEMTWEQNPLAGLSFAEQPHCTAILSLENAAPLGEDLTRVARIKQMGISMVTLVWNGRNAVGAGVDFPEEGLTSFGRQLIAELEAQEILVDASHLNERGFFDLARIAKKPFVVSHANARAVCPHKRNLTDTQIRTLFAQGGLLGVTITPQFVSGRADYGFADLARHIEHLLSLEAHAGKGQHCLAIGSDFDGIDAPSYLPGIEAVADLWRDMVDYIGEPLTRGIFFDNAARFYQRAARGTPPLLGSAPQ